MADAERAQIFNPRLVAGLIAAGIIAFAAFVLLSAYAGDFRSGRDGRPHALSVSADGFAGIVKLVELTDGNPWLLRSETELTVGEELLVVALEPQTSKEALATLVAKRGARATLVILPKWFTVADPTHPGWVRTFGAGIPSPAAAALSGLRVDIDKVPPNSFAAGQGILAGIRLPVPHPAQVISGKEVTPLLATGAGGALLARVGETPLYVLADPDLMNNQGLKDPRTARAALQILAALNSTDAEGVGFDLTLNGFGRSPSLLKLPFEPPFLPLTLALFAAALLAGLHGAFRFGPEAEEERAIAFGKAALVHNSAGLIQRARREHRTGGAYADLVRESAAAGSGAPASLRGPALDAYLDRLSQDEGPVFSGLVDRARSASDRFELLAAARALFQWKKDHIR